MTSHYFVDLHIHIGRTQTHKPVKITGARNLTLASILEEASVRKGMEVVGIIDCHVPEVLAEIKQLIRSGQAQELAGGGVRYGQTTLVMGTEMEVLDSRSQGPIHLLCYLPTVEHMSAFSRWMSRYQKNITLSSQRSYIEAIPLQRKVKELAGLFIPAHIFTPFKSLYGKGVNKSLEEVFLPELIDAVELGLSSDTRMADQIKELHAFSFLSNSDAHSLAKIGREYQQIRMAHPDFTHLQLALKTGGIAVNYGLDPKLGKYHQEVSKRIQELANTDESAKLISRPPYIHQVPLEYIPQLGRKRLEKLLKQFGTEMKIIHQAKREELETMLPAPIVANIMKAREGSLSIRSGGSGKYGKVSYP